MKELTKLILIALAMTAGVMTSCSNDDAVENTGKEEKVAVQFSSKISVASRAAGTTWTAGDRIGIFMNEAGQSLSEANIRENALNIAYVTAAGDGKFAPVDEAQTIYFPIHGTVDFYAYYPQQTVTDCKLALNVADQSNQEAIDLMYSKVTGKDKEQPAVTLSFAHQLSNIILDVQPGDGLTAADLAGLTVKVKSQCTTATYDLATGEKSNDGDVADVAMKSVTAGSRYEAILLPSGANSCVIEFDLNNGHDAPFVWTMPTTLEAGMQYHYTKVKLSRTAAEVEGIIQPWAETTDDNENVAM